MVTVHGLAFSNSSHYGQALKHLTNNLKFIMEAQVRLTPDQWSFVIYQTYAKGQKRRYQKKVVSATRRQVENKMLEQQTKKMEEELDNIRKIKEEQLM